MTKYNTNDKLTRTLRLLNSLINRNVRSLMVERGFDDAELAKGWRLFERAAGKDIVMKGSISLLDGTAKKLLAKADQWENLHFTLADATLRHEYPELHARLFLNLTKTSGPELLVNITTFLRRLDELEQEGDQHTDSALALLAKRGLDRAARDAAQALMDEGINLDFNNLPTGLAGEAAERQQHIDHMWHWTKDWSEIARTVVEDKRLRIHMGISQPTRSGSTDVDADPILGTDTPDAPPEPVSPAPPTPVVPVAPPSPDPAAPTPTA